jgi:hypothetical protein
MNSISRFLNSLVRPAALALQSVLLAAPVMAHTGDFSVASLRQEARASQVRMKGTLSCMNTKDSNGSPCDLRFKDKNSGRIYNLSNASTARQLFNDGEKKVAIEGSIENGETINIATVNTY